MFRSSSRRRRSRPAVPRGHRAYVVGDIHGRLDLLDQLLAKIDADLTARPARKSLLVFVGDLIDRGPQSAQVIERLRTYRRDGVRTGVPARQSRGGAAANPRRRCSALIAELAAVRRRPMPQELWRRCRQRSARSTRPRALRPSARPFRREHVEFLESFVDTCRFGDYLFVHAGIRPGVELEQQTPDGPALDPRAVPARRQRPWFHRRPRAHHQRRGRGARRTASASILAHIEPAS